MYICLHVKVSCCPSILIKLRNVSPDVSKTVGCKFHKHPFSGSSVVICEGISVANLEVHFFNFRYEYGIKIPDFIYVYKT